MIPKVNTFIAGCQKTGSTWLYQCFREHPEIFVPSRDAIHYFTINHFRGLEWYHDWFSEANGEKILCDGTPSYIRDPKAAQRIYDYNPNAKLIITLRNPIERSFSHYWHQKRKKMVSFSFEDVIYYSGVGNYDIFDIWIKSSFYSEQLNAFMEIFPRENIQINLFDDLKKNPSLFIREIFQFIGVDKNFHPSILNKKINHAPKNGHKLTQVAHDSRFSIVKYGIRKMFRKRRGIIANTNHNEYESGIPSNLEDDLWILFQPEIDRLSKLIGRDLSHWSPK